MTVRPEYAWLPPALMTLLVWGLWAFLPKLALEGQPPPSALFWQSVGGLLVALPVLVALKGKLKFERVPVAIVLGTTTLSCISALLYFFALKTGPVAAVATLTAMYPAVCVILARFVLKEQLTNLQKLAVLMALSAAVLLALP